MYEFNLTTKRMAYEPISFGCILISVIFFLVLSQFIFSFIPDIVSQAFRPVIVITLVIMVEKRKIALHEPAHTISLFAAFYCGFVLLLHDIDSEVFISGMNTVMFLLMFYTATKVHWNHCEIRLIIFSVFFGAFICTVILLACNPVLDFSVANSGSGHIKFLNREVNRNLNAYACAIGFVIGLMYLIKGRNIPKLLFFLCTVILGYGLLYSQCRGAFLSAIAACAILAVDWLVYIKRTRGDAAFLLWLIFLVAFVIISYFSIKNSELRRLIDADSTSGRDILIKDAWQLFLDSDLFGKIFGNGYMYETRTTQSIISHFAYTVYLVATGIIGVSLITAMFISSAARLRGSIPFAFFVIAFARTFFEPLDYYAYIPLIISSVSNHYLIESGGSCSALFSRKR